LSSITVRIPGKIRAPRAAKEPFRQPKVASKEEREHPRQVGNEAHSRDRNPDHASRRGIPADCWPPCSMTTDRRPGKLPVSRGDRPMFFAHRVGLAKGQPAGGLVLSGGICYK
jgi:hypothetical protein